MIRIPNPDYVSTPPFKALAAEVDDAARVEALHLFMKPFHDRMRELLTAPRPNATVRIGVGDDLLRRLQDDGYCMTRIAPAAKARLRELALPFADEVAACVEERASMGLKACQLVLEGDAGKAIRACVDEILTDTNIYAVASAFAGKPLSVYRTALQVNTAQSTRDRYGAVDEQGLPAHPTSYMHIDSAGWPWAKVLIYLDEVTLAEGPFRYVSGTQYSADDFELAVRKTNRKLPMPLNLFMALPEQFRLNADFGDFLDPAAKDAAEALANERPVCDGESDLILFNYNGVHRGGFVRRGKRYMLQCNLKTAR